jgi:hypothetical protein
MVLRRLVLISALMIAITSCASQGTAPSASTPTSMPPESAGPSLPAGDVPLELLEAAVADAAERAGVEAGSVSVLLAERVTWSDGSLGCPEPGMMYTQALVPGYRVVVEAGGNELAFHGASGGDGLRFCAQPEPPAEGGGDR